MREYEYDTHTGTLLNMKDYRGFNENDIDDYIKTAYTYNSAGLVTQITYSDKIFTDDNNPSGITEQYTVQYDGRGYIVGERLDTDYSKTEAATSIYKAYEYDAIGRLLKSASGETQQTGWDNWDRLTQYTYDRVGNRLTMNDGTDSLAYTYDQSDQLQEINKNSDIQTTYEYDLRGNQTKESSKYFDLTVGGVTTTYYNTTDYSYNLRNQMTGTQISTPGADTQTGEVTYETLTASNVYNAQGQRVQKTEGEGTTKYFYSGTALFYTTNGWGTLTTENILDLGGQIAASKRFQDPNEPETNPFANKYYFYNYDIRGSVTNIVGPDGKLVTGYGYDEFGNQSRSGDGSFLNEVTFTGSVSDASTGLQYMNARFYQPTTGRFISQDSYSGNAYDPWTQHLYSYCMNNPTNFFDPTGYKAIPSSKYLRDKSRYYFQMALNCTQSIENLKVLADTYLYSNNPSLHYAYNSVMSSIKQYQKDFEKYNSLGWDYKEKADINEKAEKIINDTYDTEEAAVVAFLKAEIPNTQADGEERAAYIIPVHYYEVDWNGDTVLNTRYELSSTYKGSTGLDNRKFIGLGAIINVPLFCEKSMVHTHPANSTGKPGFSNEDKDWMIDFLGCTNVYMGMPGDVNGRGVYKLTSSGAVTKPNSSDLLPVAYY